MRMIILQIGAEAEAGLASWAGSGGAVAAASVTVLPDCRMLSSYAFAGIDCAEVFKVSPMLQPGPASDY